ncbi:hypothetical protein BLOT_011205 [Blomia tropicalis]|nr:hypothetical protein BLOT_011205 [Blomia tropicalis]
MSPNVWMMMMMNMNKNMMGRKWAIRRQRQTTTTTKKKGQYMTSRNGSQQDSLKHGIVRGERIGSLGLMASSTSSSSIWPVVNNVDQMDGREGEKTKDH